MSKGRGGTIANLGLKSRQRSTIVLESSPSAEIASYDYEAALYSQPELGESHADDIEARKDPLEDCPAVQREETTPRDLGKEFTPKTVCFSTDDQIYDELTSAGELATENPSRQKITQRECVACKNIVNESGDEGGDSITDSEEFRNIPVAPVESEMKKHGETYSAARKERSNKNSPKIKASFKDLARRNIVSLNGNKNSKIPRATTITCAAARVYQTVRIPSRGSSKTSLCKRSSSTIRNKPTKFITELNEVSVTKAYDILERTKGSTLSIVDIKLNKSKASRISLEKEECTDVDTGPQPCEESSRIQVGSAGDHRSPPSATAIVKNVPLNNACRSCNETRETVNLKLSIHNVQEPWSDSKSSPEIRSRDPWSKTLKMSPYVESTSEDVDLSSEYSTDSIRPKKKSSFARKTSSKSPMFQSRYMGNFPRFRPRRRARFSFLNTLFDIVFWPFLFLRTNR